MVQQAHVCSDCGKQLGYVAGLRGFGLRERRHAARCLARAGTALASVESFIRMNSSPTLLQSVATENSATKTDEMEDTQVPCAVPEPAEECMKLLPSPVSRRSAIMSPEDVHRAVSGFVEVASPPLLPFAPYYSANFRMSPAPIWDQLYMQFPEASESSVVTGDFGGEERRCGLGERITTPRFEAASKQEVRILQLQLAAQQAELAEKVAEQSAARAAMVVKLSSVKARLATISAKVSAENGKPDCGDSLLPQSLAASLASGDLASAASMLTAALASGDRGLAAALDQVMAEQPLREDQFPASAEIDPRSS